MLGALAGLVAAGIAFILIALAVRGIRALCRVSVMTWRVGEDEREKDKEPVS
jgi:hypothetical protein